MHFPGGKIAAEADGFWALFSMGVLRDERGIEKSMPVITRRKNVSRGFWELFGRGLLQRRFINKMVNHGFYFRASEILRL